MFEGIEKLPVYFISLFHGLVTAYFVYLYTDIDISDTYFVLFVLFCSVVNIVIVRIFLFFFWYIPQRIHLGLKLSYVATADPRRAGLLQRLDNLKGFYRRLKTFDPNDVLAQPTTALYFSLCLGASIVSGYGLATAYQDEWALALRSHFEWPKTSDRSMLERFFKVQCNNKVLSKQARQNCQIEEYMEVWWKGSGAVSVGYISRGPTGYRGKQIVQLSDACELTMTNGELRYPAGKIAYQPGSTAFVDVSSPEVLFVQIVPAPNPCETASAPAKSPDAGPPPAPGKP
jgi:hypothetical protein